MIAKAGALAVLMAIAPIQCAHNPDPNERREDTAGDALWSLSQKQEAEHNDVAAGETLQFLIDHYPSSRHTEAAKDDLKRLGAAPSADRADAGTSQ